MMMMKPTLEMLKPASTTLIYNPDGLSKEAMQWWSRGETFNFLKSSCLLH